MAKNGNGIRKMHQLLYLKCFHSKCDKRLFSVPLRRRNGKHHEFSRCGGRGWDPHRLGATKRVPTSSPRSPQAPMAVGREGQALVHFGSAAERAPRQGQALVNFTLPASGAPPGASNGQPWLLFASRQSQTHPPDTGRVLVRRTSAIHAFSYSDVPKVFKNKHLSHFEVRKYFK